MSTTDLRAIETVYRNYRFRSRLEARWAVFFDALGVDFEYQTEGYELGAVRYLPDFYLPQSRTFVEVKARRGDSIDRKPLAAVAAVPALFDVDRADRRHMVIVYGDPSDADSDLIGWVSWLKEPHVSKGGLPVTCPTCHLVKFSQSYRSISARWWHTCGDAKVALPVWQAFVLDATIAARQARFEHGEQPSLTARVKHRFHDTRGGLYLAGKIGRDGNDWRDQVGAPAGDREHKGAQFVMGGEITTRYGGWKYGGPDLTVDHNEIQHGVALECLSLLRGCHSVFAWIDRSDVHGTMAEIGAWQGMGMPHLVSPLFVAFRSERIKQQVWFAADLATCWAITPDVRQAWDAFTEWHEYWRCYQDVEP